MVQSTLFTCAIVKLDDLIWLNVVVVNPDVVVSVKSGVCVVKGQTMEDLVHDGPKDGAATGRCQKHLGVCLCPCRYEKGEIINSMFSFIVQ